jgi:hypothetical protein
MILDEVVSEVILPRVRIRDPMALSIVASVLNSTFVCVDIPIMPFEIRRP